MRFPCPERVRCPSPENPIANFTSERDDGPVFTGNNYPVIPPDPTGSDPTTYTAKGCISNCTSTESQAAADACAARQAYLCTMADGGTITTNDEGGTTDIPSGPAYFNVEATAKATCPDGSEFSYTVPAGTIAAPSQAQADQLAQAAAKEGANNKMFCLPDLPEVCAGDSYSFQIIPTRGQAPFTWDFTVGGPGTASWPAWLAGTPAEAFYRLSSGATEAGQVTFTLRVTDATGARITRSYTLTVVGFSDAATLPVATKGQAYSYQLTPVVGSGGALPADTSTVNALLPAGLSMSSTFLISGTPTTVGTSTFTPIVYDANVVPPNPGKGIAAACGKTFTLQVVQGCPDWTQLVFGAPTLDPGTGTCDAQVIANVATVTAGWTNDGSGLNPTVSNWTGEKLFTGNIGPCNCRLRARLSWTGDLVGGEMNGGVTLGVFMEVPVFAEVSYSTHNNRWTSFINGVGMPNRPIVNGQWEDFDFVFTAHVNPQVDMVGVGAIWMNFFTLPAQAGTGTFEVYVVNI